MHLRWGHLHWSTLTGPGRRKTAIVGTWWASTSCNSASNPGSEHLNCHLAGLKLSFYVILSQKKTSERLIFFRVLFHASPLFFMAHVRGFSFLAGCLLRAVLNWIIYYRWTQIAGVKKKPATKSSLKDLNYVLKLTERKGLLICMVFYKKMAIKTLIMTLFYLF